MYFTCTAGPNVPNMPGPRSLLLLIRACKPCAGTSVELPGRGFYAVIPSIVQKTRVSPQRLSKTFLPHQGIGNLTMWGDVAGVVQELMPFKSLGIWIVSTFSCKSMWLDNILSMKWARKYSLYLSTKSINLRCNETLFVNDLCCRCGSSFPFAHFVSSQLLP